MGAVRIGHPGTQSLRIGQLARARLIRQLVPVGTALTDRLPQCPLSRGHRRGSKAVHGIDDDANSTTCNRSSLQPRLRSQHGAASAAPLQRSRTRHALAMLPPAFPTARVTSNVERTTSSAQDGGRARRDTTPGEKNGQQEAGPNATLTYSSLALLSREQNAVQAWTPVS
ncbi:hypothetical protein BJD11_19550 [Xanthomonas euvesicatoria]|uniref:Uncharacterized protein n=1 Tax=Xanthomonas euvesicatoria pv. vesicatoria (strain 85-10) TaxID=316273 RepID=Q3BXX7_XANE5|nr:hypothetical protein BJD11_19550 [Xanthomonas euvesicatoria]CAJ22286.1 hypothetical protein XCV0655 [Xanthomonas euvesicatoria pv. vesicatoria str. 85-10]